MKDAAGTYLGRIAFFYLIPPNKFTIQRINEMTNILTYTFTWIRANRFSSMLFDKRADEFGEKAVVIVLVVLGGLAAFAAFGSAVSGRITEAAGAI